MKTLTALSVQFSVLPTLERHDFYVVHNCITSKRKGGHQAMVEGFCMISMLQAMSTSYTMLHYVVTLCYTQWCDCLEYL